MDVGRIVKNCIEDRNLVYNSHYDSFIKKFSIDLILKSIILLINSVGFRNNTNGSSLYFVDEVNNNSMSRNLICTYNKSIKSGNRSLLINYYKFNCTNSHLKLGIILPIVLIVFVVVTSTFALFVDIVTFKSFNLVIKILVLIQLLYILSTNALKDDIFYLMTDHHFFSSIFANVNAFNTIVLQHGLVLDKRFYYPIRANKFYAWGQRSKDLLNCSNKVEITGTYKFDELIYNGNKDMPLDSDSATRVLYCVSSLDNEKTINEISVLCNFVKKYDKYELIIKDHPGSLFDQRFNVVNDLNLTVYKEKLISDIDFDLAIVGDSTVVLDLAVLKKPFIYFDNKPEYFKIYSDIFLCAKDNNELCDCILNYKLHNYDEVSSVLYKNELNDSKCNIFV